MTLAVEKMRTNVGRSAATVVLAFLAVIAGGCSSTSTRASQATSASVTVPARTTSPAASTPAAHSAGVAAVIAPELSATPNGMRVGFGSVWVANHPTPSLDRINPTTNAVKVINLPEQACFIPWIGAGRVWVGHCDGSQRSWAIDPATDTIVGTVSAFAIQAAFIGHAMWLESNDFTRVLRFDTRTLRRTGAINIEGLPVSGGGYLWVIGQDVPGGTDHQTIYQIDPATDRVIRRIHTPNIGIYGRTIYAYGALWEIGQGTGRLLRVNSSTRAITVFHEPGGSTLTDGYEIFPLAARGSIWARTSDSRILRINPVTGRATAAYPGDANSAGMLAYTANTLWVANVQAASIWREPVRPHS